MRGLVNLVNHASDARARSADALASASVRSPVSQTMWLWHTARNQNPSAPGYAGRPLAGIVGKHAAHGRGFRARRGFQRRPPLCNATVTSELQADRERAYLASSMAPGYIAPLAIHRREKETLGPW